MKTKILFVNDEMTMGGVSRILNTLLHYLENKDYEIDLLVLHPRGEMMNEIPAYVNVLESSSVFDVVDYSLSELTKNRQWMKVVKKCWMIFLMKSKLIRYVVVRERKKILKKHYDVEFSAKEGFCTVFTAYGDSTKKLNWVQVDYKEHNYSKNYMPLLKEALSKIDMNLACSKQVCDSYKEVFGIQHVDVCHNLMNIDRIIELSNQESESFFATDGLKLIAVARFHPQKSIDRLIRAVAYAKEKQCELQLALIGGGSLEDELKQLSHQLECDDIIQFYGFSSNPYPAIKQADCFVLSSLYEGYPTIVLESFLSQTPVLSCEVAGVREQIVSEEHGWIIENSQEALNEAIVELYHHVDLLRKYKQKLSSYRGENDEILRKLEGYFHV